MTSPQIEQIWVTMAGQVPANKNTPISDPLVHGFLKQAQTGFPFPHSAEMDNYSGPFGDALNKIMDRGDDPIATVNIACAAMDRANNK